MAVWSPSTSRRSWPSTPSKTSIYDHISGRLLREPARINSITMKIREIAKLVDGEIVGAPVDETYEVTKAFASDLMSDVLRFHMDDTVLITGLCNNQTMRTSEMADLKVVLIGRDKQPDEDMLELAEDADITIIKSKYSIFKLSGILYAAGIEPLY